MTGRLESIWIKRTRGGPMEAVRSAALIERQGIDGNANFGGRRQVTLIERGAWSKAETELGVEVDPAARRANLMIDGVDLAESRGQILQIGAIRIGIMGETRPCPTMDRAQAGLMAALDPDWRAGAFGVVLAGGQISTGDEVRWDDAADRPLFDPQEYESHRARAV